MDCQEGKRCSQQHYAAGAKVQITGSAYFALTSDGGADLLDDVSYKTRFFRIDFGYRAFEFYVDISYPAGGDGLAQDDPENRCLLIQQERQGGIVSGGPDRGYFNPRLVRRANIVSNRASGLVSAYVRIQVKEN
jgi:hypothetical protein